MHEWCVDKAKVFIRITVNGNLRSLPTPIGIRPEVCMDKIKTINDTVNRVRKQKDVYQFRRSLLSLLTPMRKCREVMYVIRVKTAHISLSTS